MSVQGDDVFIDFEDGSREVGNVLVGCDGSHSEVREFLVGREAAQVEDTGHTMINYPGEGYTPAQAQVLRSRSPIVTVAHNHSKVPGAAVLAGTTFFEGDSDMSADLRSSRYH